MTVTLRPEVGRLIDEQVKLGRYSSAEAVIEAAMAELVGGTIDEKLDVEDLAAIAESDAEFDRGEGIDLADLRAEFAARYGTPR